MWYSLLSNPAPGTEHHNGDGPGIGSNLRAYGQVVPIAASDSPPKNASARIMAGNRCGEVVETVQRS